jgi:intracellular septation protein
MHLVSLGILTLVGGATLLLKDPIYFMWKPTLLNWLFALVFLVSAWWSGKTLVERMMGASISVPDFVWKRLNLAWISFFVLSGTLNILVAYQFSEETWVNFKLFGLLGLTVIFIFLQALYLARHVPEGASEEH